MEMDDGSASFNILIQISEHHSRHDPDRCDEFRIGTRKVIGHHASVGIADRVNLIQFDVVSSLDVRDHLLGEVHVVRRNGLLAVVSRFPVAGTFLAEYRLRIGHKEFVFLLVSLNFRNSPMLVA